MKAKAIICVLLAFTLVVAIACKDEPDTGCLRVELDKGYRTISPTDASMDIVGYRIVPTGPDGKQGSVRYTYYSYCNLENISLGKWKLEAYGFNKDRIDVAYGCAEAMVTHEQSSAVIKVNKLIGEGSLSLDFFWDKASVKNPLLKLYLKSKDSTDGEKELNPSITASEGKAVLMEQKLAAGSYSLRGELFDGNKKVSGFIEAVRITNSGKTEGKIQLEIGKLETGGSGQGGSGNIDIDDTTATPLDLSIAGVEKIVTRDTPFTVSLQVGNKNVNLNTISAEWYLDGVLVGKGLKCNISSGELGDHRIDVVASTSDQGSTGSAYATFSIVTTKKPGMPYSMSQIGADKISLGENLVIRFLPNGRLLIAANDKKTIQVLSVGADGMEKINTYSFSDLQIDGTITDMGASGIASDTNLTVYLCSSNPTAIIALSYSSMGDSLQYIGRQENLIGSHGEKIANVGPIIGMSNGGYVKATAVAVSTLNNKEKSIFLLKPNLLPSDTDYVLFNPMPTFKFLGEGPILSLDYSEKSDTLTVVTGSAGNAYEFYHSTLSDSLIVKPTPVSDDPAKIDAKNYESFTRGIMGRIFEKVDNKGYILAHDALYLYASGRNKDNLKFPMVQKDKSFYFTNHRGKIPALLGSYDNLYFYMIDNLCRKLYILTFENGAFKCDKENDFVLLPSCEYTKIEISRDGRYVILYNPSCPSDDIILLKITR